MTKGKDLKRLVRERMARTGESYTAARANIVRGRRAPGKQSGTPPPTSGQLAREAVEEFVAGRLDDVRARFDEPMLRAASLENLQSVADEMARGGGDLHQIDDPLRRRQLRGELYDFGLRYENLDAHIQVVIRDGLVAGLVVLPGQPTGRWRKSDVSLRDMLRARLRSWRARS